MNNLLPLTFNPRTQKDNYLYANGNPGHNLGQAQKCMSKSIVRKIDTLLFFTTLTNTNQTTFHIINWKKMFKHYLRWTQKVVFLSIYLFIFSVQHDSWLVGEVCRGRMSRRYK